MANDVDPNMGRYVGIGIQMAVGVGLGLFVGRWLDDRYGWAPWGVLCGAALGLFSGMYALIRDGIRANRN